MTWVLIVFLAGVGWMEFPLFPNAELCVKAIAELKVETPNALFACSPAGQEV